MAKMTKKKQKALRIASGLLLILLGIACIGFSRKQEKNGGEYYREIAESADIVTTVAPSSPEETPSATETESVTPVETTEETTEEEEIEPGPEARIIDFDSLKAINKECVGWIYAPDTMIDFPFVTTKKNEYSYYEKHLFDGTGDSTGCVFLDHDNAGFATSDNTIIYAHNRKSGTMFGTLKYYHELEFAQSHPIIYIYTEDKTYGCEVVFTGWVDPGSNAYLTDLSTSQNANAWQRYLAARNTLGKSFAINPGDKFVSLSTCSGSYRTLVVARIYPIEDVIPETTEASLEETEGDTTYETH